MLVYGVSCIYHWERCVVGQRTSSLKRIFFFVFSGVFYFICVQVFSALSSSSYFFLIDPFGFFIFSLVPNKRQLSVIQWWIDKLQIHWPMLAHVHTHTIQPKMAEPSDPISPVQTFIIPKFFPFSFAFAPFHFLFFAYLFFLYNFEQRRKKHAFANSFHFRNRFCVQSRNFLFAKVFACTINWAYELNSIQSEWRASTR